MPKPLRSETAQTRKVLKPLVSQTGQSEDIRFRDFGTLDPGKPSGPGTLASIALNVAAVFILIVIWKASPLTVEKPKDVTLVYPEVTPPPPPPPVKLPPPPRIKTPPPVEPKVVLKEVKIPDPPKVEVVKVAPVTPQPVIKASAPKREEAPPAPKVVPVHLPQAAAIPNADKVPTPVRIGDLNSPVAPSKVPVVSAVHIPTSGAPGMPDSNSGRGNPTKVSLGGSGLPSGQNMNGTGVRNVSGIPHGVVGGTGNGQGNSTGTRPQQVAMGAPPAAVAVTHPPVAVVSKAKPPQVLYQPKPAYTADATKNNIEGTIRVRIRVSSTGQVTVIGIVSGALGHGLDQNAIAAAQGIRFRPALDANGNPTDWEGVVNVQFQIAT